MAAGAIVAALVYFAPRGGDFLKFLPVVTSESAQETQQNPQQDKDKQQPDDSSVKNEKPKDDSQQQAMEEIALRMRFIDGKLYVGNWPCPDKETLEKTIQKILTQYANKEVRIKYYRDGNDPYKASYSAQKLLKKAGFHVTVHRGDTE